MTQPPLGPSGRPAQFSVSPYPAQAPVRQPAAQQWNLHQQQTWAGQNPMGAPSGGPSLGTHLRRAIDWNVAEVKLAPRERQELTAAGIEARLQGLFAWRRSTLLVALPLLLLSVALSFIEAARADMSGVNALGKLWNFLPPLGLLFVPIGAVAVILRWTEMRRTSTILISCWLLSIALPLLAALIPLNMIIDIDGARRELELQGGDVGAYDDFVFLSRMLQAIAFALILLPVVLSVPGGVLRGAARVKSLFPSSSLPGWFLVAVAPLYSLFTIVLFVLIVQILGNGLLLVGVAILAFTPWLFVIYRKAYGRPLSTIEARTELSRASRLAGWLLLAATACITTFLLTAEVANVPVLGSGDEAVFSYVLILRTLGEIVSRGLVTTVVFSMIFLSMVFAEWRSTTMMSGDIRREHDEQMSALQHFFGTQTGGDASHG